MNFLANGVASKCYILTPFIQKRCTNFYAVRNIIALHTVFCSYLWHFIFFFYFCIWLEFIFSFRFGTVFHLCLCSCYSWHFFSHELRECSHVFAPLHFGAESESSKKSKKDISLFYSVESLIIYFTFLFGLTTGKTFNNCAFCSKSIFKLFLLLIIDSIRLR